MSIGSVLQSGTLKINWLAVTMVTMVLAVLVNGYIKYTSINIEPDVLQQIEQARPGDTITLEEHKQQVLIMEERGWYFIAIGALILCIFLWSRGTNAGQPTRHKKNYRVRITKQLNARVKASLSFTERLRLKFMNLTDHDLKVAQMLLDGLSSKEIANELNISPSSVNTARYRLRKRMMLTPETDLLAALRGI